MKIVATEYDYLNGLIETTATRYGNWYHGYVDRGDISQHLWVWALDHTQTVERWHADNETRAGFERVLGSVLRVEAGDYCRKTKADTLGYSIEDEFRYTKGQLETLVPLVFDKENWLDPPKKLVDTPGGASGRALNEGNNWVTTLTDVSHAMSFLSTSQVDLLWKVYVAETPLVRLEKELTLSRRGLEHRIDACYRKLIRVLNDAKPRNQPGTSVGHPGTRHAVSNAYAAAVTSDDWAGNFGDKLPRSRNV